MNTTRLRWSAVLFLLLILGVHMLAPATAQEAPQYKAIWEPVSYPADLSLTDVFFATPAR